MMGENFSLHHPRLFSAANSNVPSMQVLQDHQQGFFSTWCSLGNPYTMYESQFNPSLYSVANYNTPIPQIPQSSNFSSTPMIFSPQPCYNNQQLPWNELLQAWGYFSPNLAPTITTQVFTPQPSNFQTNPILHSQQMENTTEMTLEEEDKQMELQEEEASNKKKLLDAKEINLFYEPRHSVSRPKHKVSTQSFLPTNFFICLKKKKKMLERLEQPGQAPTSFADKIKTPAAIQENFVQEKIVP